MDIYKQSILAVSTNESSIEVDAQGDYSVTLTIENTGCTATDAIFVLELGDMPVDVMTTGGTLSCDEENVEIFCDRALGVRCNLI